MGMYDTITHKGRDWQTKDLDCLLDTYLVNEFHQLVKIFPGEYGELPRYDPSDFHGWLTCSDSRKDPATGQDVEPFTLEHIRMKFTDGRLVHVENLPNK